jgi:hypothetical protein
MRDYGVKCHIEGLVNGVHLGLVSAEKEMLAYGVQCHFEGHANGVHSSLVSTEI